MTPYIRSVDASGMDLPRAGTSCAGSTSPFVSSSRADHHRRGHAPGPDGQPGRRRWRGLPRPVDSAFVHPVREASSPKAGRGRSIASIAEAVTTSYNDDAFQRVIYTESHRRGGQRPGPRPLRDRRGRCDRVVRPRSGPPRCRARADLARHTHALPGPGVPPGWLVPRRRAAGLGAGQRVPRWCGSGRDLIRCGATSTARPGASAVTTSTSSTPTRGVQCLRLPPLGGRRTRTTTTVVVVNPQREPLRAPPHRYAAPGPLGLRLNSDPGRTVRLRGRRRIRPRRMGRGRGRSRGPREPVDRAPTPSSCTPSSPPDRKGDGHGSCVEKASVQLDRIGAEAATSHQAPARAR